MQSEKEGARGRTVEGIGGRRVKGLWPLQLDCLIFLPYWSCLFNCNSFGYCAYFLGSRLFWYSRIFFIASSVII